MATPTPATWAPKNDGEFVDHVLYLLKAPMNLYPGWEDSFRDQWDKVLMERMVHHKDLFAQEMCTEYEAMLYISSATLVAPPSHDWYVIYMYLFRRWSKEKADQVGADIEELNINQQEDLDRLRQWVFKGQMLHLKKGKGVSQETVKALAKEKKQIEVERPKLF